MARNADCAACNRLPFACPKHATPLSARPTTWTDTPEHTVTVDGGHVTCTCGYEAKGGDSPLAARVIAAEHANGTAHLTHA